MEVVFDIDIWDIDVNAFVIRLIRQVLERRFLPWTPSNRVTVKPLPYRKEDGYIEDHILEITMALEKLSCMEYQLDEEEYAHLYMILGTSEEDFIDFFVNSVSTCNPHDYKPFDFIRWLRYITDFSMFCYVNGFPDAINHAALSIIRKIVQLQNVFTDFNNWRKLVNETGRILNVKFAHPYMFNCYLHMKNGSIRELYPKNGYRSRCRRYTTSRRYRR